MRRKRPLDRSTGVERDSRLIVIASEDECAVKQYFGFFKSSRIQFKVLETQDGKSSPEHVLARLDQFAKEFDFGANDEFWVVLDSDHWIESNHIPNLLRVIQECRQKGYRIALSYPCFELWLLLHFADFPTEKHLSSAELERRVRHAAGGSYNKTKVYNLPITDEAVRRAIRSAAERTALGDVPTELHTQVHLILQDLIDKKIISIPE